MSKEGIISVLELGTAITLLAVIPAKAGIQKT